MIKIRKEDEIIPQWLSKTLAEKGTSTYHLRILSIIISFRWKDAVGKTQFEIERVK